MRPFTIHYTVIMTNRTNHTLEVEAIISPMYTPRTIQLFKGKVRPLKFEVNCGYEEHDKMYTLYPSSQDIKFTYTVSIGFLGKHGLQGAGTKDFTCFSGDQIFIFPIDLLASENLIPSKIIDTVSIDYVYDQDFTPIVPFSTNNYLTKSKCTRPSWHHSYELMKSAYVFGKFKKWGIQSPGGVFEIFTSSAQVSYSEETIDQLHILYKYYAKLFDTTSHQLTLVLLNDTSSEYFGGAGAHIVCSSFDETKLRDWQLIAHRMFHSFMDTVLPLSYFHTPPTLWLTEALATYYENRALTALDDSFTNRLGFDLQREFNRLYNRYLYVQLNPIDSFVCRPMDERFITEAYQLEFLHYTHAPLIVKYIEDMLHTSDQVLSTLLKIPLYTPFSMHQFLITLLGDATDDFIKNYLMGLTTLPMWYLGETNTFKGEKLIQEINDFEYLLYTWKPFKSTQSTQPRVFDAEHLILGKIDTTNLQPNWLNRVDDRLQTYSIDLYHLLNYLNKKV